MSTTSGACVSRARFAAADGMPMPTKQTVPSFRRRAASMVMISVGVKVSGTTACSLSSTMGCVPGTCPDLRRLHEFLVRLRSHDVLLHPFQEGVALPRDRVPCLAERVV